MKKIFEAAEKHGVYPGAYVVLAHLNEISLKEIKTIEETPNVVRLTFTDGDVACFDAKAEDWKIDDLVFYDRNKAVKAAWSLIEEEENEEEEERVEVAVDNSKINW